MPNRFLNIDDDWETKPSRIKIAISSTDNIKKTIELKDDFKILDYGCGTGQITFNLYNSKYNFEAMDSSPAMIEKLNEKIEEKEYKNIKAILHDIQKEDLPKNRYNLLAISMTLHHIKDTAMFLKKAKSSLLSGGYLCINDLVSEDGTFHSKHGNDGVHHFGYDKDELEKLVLDNGFELISYTIVYTDIREGKNYPIFQLIAKAI